MKRKNKIPKRRCAMAMALASPLFRKRVVPLKRKYSRKNLKIE